MSSSDMPSGALVVLLGHIESVAARTHPADVQLYERVLHDEVGCRDVQINQIQAVSSESLEAFSSELQDQ